MPDSDVDKVVKEIMSSIEEDVSQSQIASEFREYTEKYLISPDRAKVTVIRDHSKGGNKPSKAQSNYHKRDYSTTGSKTHSHALAISSVKKGMVGITVKGVVSQVRPDNIRGTDVVTAILSDDTGSINVTFWWAFSDLKDGDNVVISHVSKVVNMRGELIIYAYYPRCKVTIGRSV